MIRVVLTCVGCNETWNEQSRFSGWTQEIANEYFKSKIPCPTCGRTGFSCIGIGNQIEIASKIVTPETH
jgi:4-hydroxy-3-methylbut-2-en-1-yl diphosphate synthase IspG/GcpE